MAGRKTSSKARRRSSPKKKQFSQKQLAQFRKSMGKGTLMPVAYDLQSGASPDDNSTAE